MKKLIILTFIVVLLFIIGFMLLPPVGKNSVQVTSCERLQAKIKKPVVRDMIETSLSNIIASGTLKSKDDLQSGFVAHYQLSNPNIVDWELLELPLSSATLKINGIRINYLDLNIGNVDSFLVGLGGRAFILYDYKRDGKLSVEDLNIKQSDIALISDDFEVVCR